MNRMSESGPLANCLVVCSRFISFRGANSENKKLLRSETERQHSVLLHTSCMDSSFRFYCLAAKALTRKIPPLVQWQDDSTRQVAPLVIHLPWDRVER